MADSTIPNLTAASALDGTELIPGSQSGVVKKVTVDQIATLVIAKAANATQAELDAEATTRGNADTALTAAYIAADVVAVAAAAAAAAAADAAADTAALTAVATLTNKRITRRAVVLGDTATITPNSDTTDIATVAALSQATLIDNPTGTPTDGQLLEIRIKTAAAQTLTHGAQYRASTDVALLTATAGSNLTQREVFEWNPGASTWDLLSTNVGH